MIQLRLSKVILYVADMSAQVQFYRDILGLPLNERYLNINYSEAFWIEFDASPSTLALHGGGGKEIGKDAPKLIFQVDDFNKAINELSAKGLKHSEVRSPAPNTLVVDALDPEGNAFSIEFKGRNEDKS